MATAVQWTSIVKQRFSAALLKWFVTSLYSDLPNNIIYEIISSIISRLDKFSPKINCNHSKFIWYLSS